MTHKEFELAKRYIMKHGYTIDTINQMKLMDIMKLYYRLKEANDESNI